MDLSSYTLVPLAHGSTERTRARCDGLPPLLITTVRNPSADHLKRLQNEFSLRDSLDRKWAAVPLSLLNRKDCWTLVQSDPGGLPLDALVAEPLPVGRLLKISIALATVLGLAHAKHIVHGDVRPSNFFVDETNGAAWLTGFGIAVNSARAGQPDAAAPGIGGALEYMAPERTARINLQADARSDLYSLGVTLYEIMTQMLPFAAVDALELVHCHIARQPIPPAERRDAIPIQLSDIVMKLLEKTREHRYQSAAALAGDLRQCLAEWDSAGSISRFGLSTPEKTNRKLFGNTLYGRKAEKNELIGAFNRVFQQGLTETVLISGDAGIGKSALIRETQHESFHQGAAFASGKFDQYTHETPYAALVQAFNGVLRSLMSQDETRLHRWRDLLRQDLGPNAQLMTTLFPVLTQLIGSQPPVPDLPLADARNRFERVFRRFVCTFAREGNPLVLALEDIQWADAATLDLIGDVITHADTSHLLLICTSRNEPTEIVEQLFDRIRAKRAPVREIKLAPLDLADMEQLLSDAFGAALNEISPLAELIYQKTGGNPFFAIQFSTALIEDGLVTDNAITRSWQWDVERIRARNYTDNVVEFMTVKLKRLSPAAQGVLAKFACLGSFSDVSTLCWTLEQTEQTVHDVLWESVQAGLIVRQGDVYRFLHDRIHQAAYGLLSEQQRQIVHLRLGRILLTNMSTDDLARQPFQVANQFKRGARVLRERDEKAEVAVLQLNAGRLANASAATALACSFFTAGMELLDASDWTRHYELSFGLLLERTKCELLLGRMRIAETLLADLLVHAQGKIDVAAAYDLYILLYVLDSKPKQAIDLGRDSLNLLGICIPVSPSSTQMTAENDAVIHQLARLSIGGIVDLPLMADRERAAAMRVLSSILEAAYFCDFKLFCVLLCRMVTMSIEQGVSGPFTHAFGLYGAIVGPVFKRYDEGYLITKAARDLVEKHDFAAFRSKAYFSMGLACCWTQPIEVAIKHYQEAFRAGAETGDLTYACYGLSHSVTSLLLRNDPLDAAWKEAKRGLDFARMSGFRDGEAIFVSQQRFISNMQGRTTSHLTFDDAGFSEAAFESKLADSRMAGMVCGYWSLKLKARFIMGDYTGALEAAELARPLLWALAAQVGMVDYYQYCALTVAVLYATAAPSLQADWNRLLNEHEAQLGEWAAFCPATFGHKHLLLLAEIARVERRDVDAMRLYESAILSADQNGFTQNAGLSLEMAARFYVERGAETIALDLLRKARRCYLRWGASGKVRQLEHVYPMIRAERAPSGLTATFDASIERLEFDSVVKASQAVSTELELGKLIQTLMRIALEHAGAERGVLLLFLNGVLQVEANARTSSDGIEVSLVSDVVDANELPASVIRYVFDTRNSVILDDCNVQNAFSSDKYIKLSRTRSLLCLPMLRQGQLSGVLYVENSLLPGAFTHATLTVLKFLVSQAAISLENARLYDALRKENDEREKAERRLRRSESFLNEAQKLSHTGSFGFALDGGESYWSEETYRILGFERDVEPDIESMLRNRLHPEDVDSYRQTLLDAVQAQLGYVHDHRLLMPDGSIKYISVVARFVKTPSGDQGYVGAIMDVTAAVLTQMHLHKARTELAHVARISSLGELAASIAHEVNQPLGAIVTNAEACLRWLDRTSPDWVEARRATERIAKEGNRAADVIRRVRMLAQKSTLPLAPVDVNEVVREAIGLVHQDIANGRILLQTELEEVLPSVMADSVQLQQVMLNLILNAIEAMQAVELETRKLLIKTSFDAEGQVHVAVTDSGIGIADSDADQLFLSFFTTKSSGMGMGLSICRSIIEAHKGRIWATANPYGGAIVQFTLPQPDGDLI